MRRALVACAAFAALVGTGYLAYLVALRAQLAGLAEQADARIALFVVAIDATVERFRYLPTVLSQGEELQALFRAPTPAAAEAANRWLRSLNATAGSAALFAVGRDGVTLATSNYLEPDGFLGRNYAFRPYIQEALRREEGRYYAVGATTGRPGYFLWHSVADASGATVGVAVVKVDLLALERDWRDAGSGVAVADRNGVVFLTDEPRWRYRPLTALDDARVRPLRDSRQYGRDVDYRDALFVEERREHGQRVVRVPDARGELRGHVVYTRPLPVHGWTISLLYPLAPERDHALVVAATTMLTLLVAMLLYLATHQRRLMIRAKLNAHRALEARVQERTAELAAANERLSAEIDERIRTERDLHQARDSLVHAAKMASLGTALAGVAHEVNQSLAALNTYVAGARVLLERGQSARVAQNLDLMAKIVERMAALTQHLKSFARKDAAMKQATDLGAVVRSALALVAYRLAEEDATADVELPGEPLHVVGNPVRLEQVVVNLASNAVDAMHERAERRLTVRLEAQDGAAVLTVADTGSGIAPENLPFVFDPFYTTKEVGRGLGLGLSISYGIVKDAGGEITVRSEPGRGTTFRVVLPLAAGLGESTPTPAKGADATANGTGTAARRAPGMRDAPTEDVA